MQSDVRVRLFVNIEVATTEHQATISRSSRRSSGQGPHSGSSQIVATFLAPVQRMFR